MMRIAIPGATTLLVVVAFVALAGWNKSSEPRVQLTITERELRLTTPVAGARDDDPGVQMHFEFARRDEPLDARNWLTDERLRAIGFVFDVMPGAPEAENTYRRALPKIAWVAFEYDGEAWRAIERRLALMREPPRHPDMPPAESSRLVPVDAAPDAEPLIARYPRGHVILRATIDLRYLPPQQNGPLVYGVIRQVIPPNVFVPREFEAPLAGLVPAYGSPRYQVDVAVGRLGLPYVTGVRR